MACRSIYYPMTEHNNPIHREEADIRDFFGDIEDSGITSAHALVGAGGDQL